jgi:glycosyltransferase involved in cell wall biosynthesis
MLLQLLRASAGSGRRQAVLTLTSADSLASQIEALGVPVINLNARGLNGGFSALREARALVRAYRPSLAMTWLHHADLFGVLLKCLCCPSLPLVWNIRCSKLAPGFLPWKNLLIVRLLARFSAIPAMIVANSTAGMREHIAVGYRRSGWRVLPNGFDTVRFAPDREAGKNLRRSFGISDDAFVVGLVARYHPMKGFDLFVRASARLAAAQPRAHFVLAGGGVCSDNQELVGWIDAAGLGKRITLLGPRNDVPVVMNALDVLVSSSTSEGFPNVIGEAMACGVPCVATNVGDSALLVGPAGRVVAAGDADALVAALESLIAMPAAEFAALRQAARTHILEKFAIADIASRYLELFDEFETSRKRITR